MSGSPLSFESDEVVDLDHAATTRVRPEVVEAMAPFLADRYGNPSGAHRLARDAVRAVDAAREQVAELVGCGPGDVVFTSGGTEADNQAISGGMPPRPGRPLCSATEHHAVLDVVEALGGATVDVAEDGRIDLGHLASRIGELGDELSIVSVMLVNNETGVVNDLDAVAAVLHEQSPEVPRIPLHTDAVQGAVWLDLRDAAAAADLISLSGHKLGGPKGVGALVARPTAQQRPLLLGGGQERGRRSGTLNVAGIIGFAAALAATDRDREVVNARVRALRDQLVTGVLAAVADSTLSTAATPTDAAAPGISNFCFAGVDSESLLLLLETAGVYASAASSCASGAQEPSHVLAAMGVSKELSVGALRLSLGHDSTTADVERALTVLPAAVERIRTFG